MSALMDAIKADLNKNKDFRNSVEVEFDGKSFTVYARPLSGNDTDWLLKKHPTFHQAPTAIATADLMVRMCQDEAGALIFEPGDKVYLMKLGIHQMAKIRDALWSDAEQAGEVEEVEVVAAEKN